MPPTAALATSMRTTWRKRRIRPAVREAWTSRIRRHWRTLAKLAALAVVGIVIYRYVAAPPVVHVIAVESVVATQTLGATGKVRGARVVELGVDIGSGASVFVHEGDTVRAGQLMLSLDRSEAAERAAAAQATVAERGRGSRQGSQGTAGFGDSSRQGRTHSGDKVGRARVDAAQAKFAM